MNITTDKQTLSKVLNAIGHVVPKRSYNESFIDKIIVNGALIATDYNIYARLEYPHEGEGEAVFPYSGLKAACKGKGRIALGAIDGRVSAGGISWPAWDVSTFPRAPSIKQGSPSVVVVGLEFHEALSLGSIARADKDGRYLLDRVLLDIREGKVSVVTTDGRRLAVASIEGEGQDGRVLIDPAAVKVLKYLAAVPEGVRLTWDGAKLFAESSAGEAWFTTLHDAAFPDYRPHMEGRIRTPLATVNRKDLLEACLGANEVTTEHLRAVEFTFWMTSLTVAVKGAGGEFSADLPITGVRGAHIYMDPAYLADGLKAVKTDRVTILASPSAPEEEGIIIEAGILRYLVMTILIDQKNKP